MSNLTLEVCPTPALLNQYNISESIVVVIDIFRATSSICYGIENGATSIIPVSSIEACEDYRESQYLLAAERDGQVVVGFDFGNSPFAYTSEKVKDKTIVLTTTNGTRAINESQHAHQIVVGSFLNLNALCDWLKAQNKNICLLCAGWKDKVNLEDSLFAGAVVYQLRNNNYKVDDMGIIAADIYSIAQGNLDGYLKKSSHSERLKKLNIEQDIAFCLQENTTTAIPILKDGKLVKLKLEIEVEAYSALE